MRQLYWICRMAGIGRGFRKYFIDGIRLTECHIDVIKEVVKI